MGNVILGLKKEQCREMAQMLITAEGFAQQRERQFNDWALKSEEEEVRKRFLAQAEEARADYMSALELRELLYRAEARTDLKGEKGQ